MITNDKISGLTANFILNNLYFFAILISLLLTTKKILTVNWLTQ
jgi:hypothetical protein